MRGHHAFEACVEQLATAIRLGVYPRGTTLPAERELAERLAGLPGDAARGDGRPARRPGWSRPPAAAAAARSSRSSPARPSARAAARITAGPPPGLAGRAGLPPDRRARRGRAGGVARPRRRTAGASSSRRTTRWPRPRKPAEHRQADSRFHLTVASLTDSPRTVEAVTSVQATLHEMLLAIPVLEHQHRPLRPPARAAGPGDPGRQAGPGPPGHGGALRRHGRAAARARGLTGDSMSETELRNDRHLTHGRPGRPDRRRRRSTPSSSRSPTCRAGCRASGCTGATSPTSWSSTAPRAATTCSPSTST